jgi:pyruvate/2-oxoglutarate dehydrogenase complex dihydrolipoamide acyltransferase (E2) component
VDILLPKIGFAMNEAILGEWLVADGAAVSEGEPLFNIESEKSLQEINAPASGILRILAEPGQTYQVGAVLGRLE